jgi:hypothetical protein
MRRSLLAQSGLCMCIRTNREVLAGGCEWRVESGVGEWSGLVWCGVLLCMVVVSAMLRAACCLLLTADC